MRQYWQVGWLSIALVVASPASAAQPPTEGNLLVGFDSDIAEFTASGAWVQTIPVPYPGGRPASEKVRDIVRTTADEIVVFNGTFAPYWSRYAFSTNTWTHETLTGWGVNNVLWHGSLARWGRTLFAPNQGVAPEIGLVGFDLLDGTTFRFANTDPEPVAVAAANGEVYSLVPGGSQAGSMILVYEAQTLAFLRSIDLGPAIAAGSLVFGRGALAAGADGTFYLNYRNGRRVAHLDASGALLEQWVDATCRRGTTISICEFIDIDLLADGTVVTSTSTGDVFFLTPDLTILSRFDFSSSFSKSIFLAAVEPIRQCNDLADNDADGAIDLADPQCTGPQDRLEAAPICGIGPELIPILALLGCARTRRRHSSESARLASVAPGVETLESCEEALGLEASPRSAVQVALNTTP